MSERDTLRAWRLDDGTAVRVLFDVSTRPLASRTNWARREAMTDEKIEANALPNPGNSVLSAEELVRMRPISGAKGNGQGVQGS